FRALFAYVTCAIDRRQSLARALHVTEPALGFLARFLRGHSAGHEIPHCHVEVKSQFVVDRALDARAVARDVKQPSNPNDSRHQSARSASFGSTRAARNAGTQLARIAIAISVTTTASRTAGSDGDTSNSSGFNHLPPRSATP